METHIATNLQGRVRHFVFNQRLPLSQDSAIGPAATGYLLHRVVNGGTTFGGQADMEPRLLDAHNCWRNHSHAELDGEAPSLVQSAEVSWTVRPLETPLPWYFPPASRSAWDVRIAAACDLISWQSHARRTTISFAALRRCTMWRYVAAHCGIRHTCSSHSTLGPDPPSRLL